MDKYREKIKKDLIRLPREGCLLFAALTSERLYPNYVYFYNTFNWGNPKILEEAISVVFQFLISKDSIDRSEILTLIEEVDLITPNTEDFSEIYVSFALDACTSVYSTLNFILDQKLEHIIDVAVYARDTVDMFIQERDDINSFTIDIENKISNDPLMIREKKRQTDVIERMLDFKTFIVNDELIDSMRDKTPIINIDALE